MRVVLVALCVFALSAAAAAAHGGAVDDAVEALASAPVYVDPDARPGLTDAQAEALADRIRESDRAVYVAVIDEQDDPAHDVVHELVSGVGKAGTYVVVAGGEFGIHSTQFDHELAEELQAKADGRPRAELAATLDDLVTRIAAAAPAESEDESSTPWLWMVLALLAIGAVAVLATVWALRRGRSRTAPA